MSFTLGKARGAMRLGLSFFALCQLLVGCSNRSAPPQVQTQAPTRIASDSELSQMLPGTWILEQDWPSNHSHSRSVVTVASNGAYMAQIKQVTPYATNAIDLEGTWQVRDGCLIDIITKDSDPGFRQGRPLPYTSSQQIMRANEQELALTPSRIFRKERK